MAAAGNNKKMIKIKFPQKQLNQLKKIGIEIVYLFGSQAEGKTHPLSDFDFGIVFEKPEKYKDNTLDVYSKLYGIFTDVLPKSYLRRRFQMREHEFDIVFFQFAPLSLQFNAIKGGRVLYEKNEEARFRYQEEVMKRNADLQYFYEMRYKAILERI